MAETGGHRIDEGSRRWSLAVAMACLLPLLLQLPGLTSVVPLSRTEQHIRNDQHSHRRSLVQSSQQQSTQ